MVRSGRTRLRPIVIAGLTTPVRLFRMALRGDIGSEADAPLARAVIGGLAVTTVLTLIPPVYMILEEWFPRRIEAPQSPAALQGETA